MGLLGLDWGNVPSWFSAGSFTVAAYVIARDRRLRARHQIDAVGIWGELAAEELEEEASVKPVVHIHIKNASNLPVHLQWVNFNAVSINQEGDVLSLSGQLESVTVPPDKELTVARDLFEGSGESVHIPDGYIESTRLLIKEYALLDNARKLWIVRPRTGEIHEIREDESGRFIKETDKRKWVLDKDKGVWRRSRLMDYLLFRRVTTLGGVKRKSK